METGKGKKREKNKEGENEERAAIDWEFIREKDWPTPHVSMSDRGGIAVRPLALFLGREGGKDTADRVIVGCGRRANRLIATGPSN